MSRKVLLNATVAAVILAGGCAVNQFQGQTGPVRTELPNAGVPETVMSNVKLKSGRKVQDVIGMVGRSKQIFNSLIKENEGSGALQTQSSVTVGDLKARGLFKNSVLSDDSLVFLIEAKGGFVQRETMDGKQRAFNYTQLVAIFDPADGDLLSYGLVP